MEWFPAYALGLALSVSPAVADDSSAVDVESRFDAKSQTHIVRIGEVVVVAKDASLKLTAGKTLSGQATFTGSVRVDGKEFQCVCERAVYNFSAGWWIFEKATFRHTNDGRTGVAHADRMMFNPGMRMLRADQPVSPTQD